MAQIRLSLLRELRRIDGVWYEVRLARLPEPEYRAVIRSVNQKVRPYRAASPVRTVEVRVHQLVTPAVQDAITGQAILAGPESDDHDSWKRYRRDRSERVYAVAKRQLSRRELRRHGLRN